MLSRALLVPGPLPPSSHLGLTLLRHVAASGLRYALYHLGLPLPESPPVRFVRLRFALAIGIVIAGVMIALAEIRLGVSEGKASYVYLLMLGLGVAKPMFGRTRMRYPEP